MAGNGHCLHLSIHIVSTSQQPSVGLSVHALGTLGRPLKQASGPTGLAQQLRGFPDQSIPPADTLRRIGEPPTLPAGERVAVEDGGPPMAARATEPRPAISEGLRCFGQFHDLLRRLLEPGRWEGMMKSPDFPEL